MNNQIKTNSDRLRHSKYPGRGIIIGLSPDAINFIQVYWIMGRSENSRNRIFKEENGFVKTDTVDKSKVKDPSLIIYYPIKVINNCHIISNGDQTDTIYNMISQGKTFKQAMDTRNFEPDPPNYTPRIAGIVDLDDKKTAYCLSILKSIANNGDYCTKQYFDYTKPIAGIGYCITTYDDDGNPLPSFSGEPYAVKLFNDIEYTANYYWELLDKQNRVSLLVKLVTIETKKICIKIINKY